MLRLCCGAARGLPCASFRSGSSLRLCQRHASSLPPAGAGKGAGAGFKVLAGTSLVTVGGAAGALAYASFDPDFRKVLEENVPGSDIVLGSILGPSPSPAPPPPPPKASPSKLKIPSPVVVTKPKPESLESSGPPPPPLDAPPPPPPPPTAPVPPAPDSKVVSVKKASPVKEEAPVKEAPPPPSVAVSPVKVTAPPDIPPPVKEIAPVKASATEVQGDPKTKQETTEPVAEAKKPASSAVPAVSPDIENTSLETVLEELCKEMKETVDGAVAGYQASSQAVIGHIQVMQKVLESNITVKDDAAWNEMFEAATIKSDAVKAAEIKEKEAIAAIDNVIESIAAGRKNKPTSTNPNLLLAEEAANAAIYQLDQAKARGQEIQNEAAVMEEYRDLVEAGRHQFHKEMASIMPDVKLGEKSGKLTEDELNMFITHAYRKVLFLQQELAKQQTLEQERFKKALEKQRLETQLVATEKIESELERQKRELELEHERRMAAIREEAEGELRAQLRRQAAAHTDHLSDVLSVQSAELSRSHEHILDEKLSEARSEHQANLASLSGTVNGLSQALTARAEADRAALRAHSLWLAATGLTRSLNQGKAKASDWTGRLLPLKESVAAVREAGGEKDSFVTAVTGAISPQALDRGVYTLDSLRERWATVQRVARRVAGIGEEGGSLLSYGLSYLASALLVDLSTRSPSEAEESLQPEELSATDIVNLATHSLDRGNLSRAVQYVALLSGEPARVASDWLSEATLTLETQQAATALVAHAEATGVQALPSGQP